MIDRSMLAEIVRYHDAESEEHEDMPRFFRKRDVDPEALMHVAMQRGLRVVMIMKGLNPNQTRPRPVALTQREKGLQVKFAGMFFDGFACGLEAHKRNGGDQ